MPALVSFGFAGVLGAHLQRVGKCRPLAPCQGGFAPWTPSLPTPVGLGFASVLGPPRSGVANVGNSPPFEVFGGTSPRPPARGLRPLAPPVCPPPLAGGLPAFWVPLVAGLLMWAARPLFLAFGGTSPKPPGRGLRPLHPRFNQGRRRPTFFKEADFSRRESGGTPPQPPPWGFAHLAPRFAHPRWLRVRRRFGSPSWRGC